MMTVKSLLFFCAALFTLHASSQTTASEPMVVYLEIPTLSVETYPSYLEVVEKNASFEAKEACTPAKVVAIRFKAARTQELTRSTDQLVSELAKAGFSGTKRLPAFNDKAFMERCKAARYTGQ